MSIVVLGIGNVLWADEGFGVRCVEALQQRWAFDDGGEATKPAEAPENLIDSLRANPLLLIALVLAALALDIVEHWVLVRPVHAVHLLLQRQQTTAHFQGGEMQRHEDHALAIGFGLA